MQPTHADDRPLYRRCDRLSVQGVVCNDGEKAGECVTVYQLPQQNRSRLIIRHGRRLIVLRGLQTTQLSVDHVVDQLCRDAATITENALGMMDPVPQLSTSCFSKRDVSLLSLVALDLSIERAPNSSRASS